MTLTMLRVNQGRLDMPRDLDTLVREADEIWNTLKREAVLVKRYKAPEIIGELAEDMMDKLEDILEEVEE